jgi:hypothetical protein
MTLLCRFSFILFAIFQVQAFAQTNSVILINSNSKELKRAAHRLRIPVEQLKNARQALQEATELAPLVDPYPFDQLGNLAQSWQRLNRPKAKTVINSFIQDLRLKASQPENIAMYQRATSAAMSLAQIINENDYEKVQEMISSWPDPPASFGDTASSYRKNLEDQAKSQAVLRLAYSDPEKASKLLSQSGGTTQINYSSYAQIAQGFMNKGKRDEALKIVDQVISDYSQPAGEKRQVYEIMNFIQMASSLDSKRAGAALALAASRLMNQPQPNTCNAKVKSGETSVDLTCNEMNFLSFLRNYSLRPDITSQALNANSSLKAKIDRIGGIDSIYTGQATMMVETSSGGASSARSVSISMNNSINPADKLNNLRQELQGKAETNPSLVRQKLQSAVKGPEDIYLLISLAQTSAYQDPDLADIALEIAQTMLSQIESTQKRASYLQSIIQASREADGEVDKELLKSGFIIADQIRQELAEKKDAQSQNTFTYSSPGMNSADQLEVALVADLSRDSFESAIHYVRTLDTGALKLASLIQIVQALSQANF